MTVPAPLQLIDVLLADKRKAREVLDADIAALERTRAILVGLVSTSSDYEKGGLPLSPTTAAVETAVNLVATHTQGSWHDAVFRRFDDGLTHTTAEIYDAAQNVSGPDVGYSAVASWLNRLAERGTLKKDGRGSFSNPAFYPRVKAEAETSSVEDSVA